MNNLARSDGLFLLPVQVCDFKGAVSSDFDILLYNTKIFTFGLR